MLIKQIVILITSSALVACAASVDTPEGEQSDVSDGRPDCIFRSSIRGYSVLDESNLIIEASSRRNYHMSLRRRAHGIEFSRGIDFDSPTGRVCAAFSQVIFIGGSGGGKYRIDSIRELSEEEHEHLLIQYGKKEPEIEQTPVPREVKGAEVEELDPAAADEPSGD